MATMKVTEKYEMTEADKKYECEKVFMGEGTPTAEEFWKIAKDDHPGVQMVMEQKEFNLAGPVKVLSEGEYPAKYAGVYMRPEESRKIFEDKGWSEVAALQLRNPMHRSHEYLAKLPSKFVTVFIIHSLVGNLKPGDIPAEVRVKCIDALVKNYFVEENVVQGGYPLDMRYAGPREGLLHATFRQNYGCSRMIIGRDHAGVGDFYGMFEAQTIFDKIPTPSNREKRCSAQPLKSTGHSIATNVTAWLHSEPAPTARKTGFSFPEPCCERCFPKAENFRIISDVKKLLKFFENTTKVLLKKLKSRLHGAATGDRK